MFVSARPRDDTKGGTAWFETNGSQETTQGAENQAQERQQEGTQGVQEVGGSSGNGTDGAYWEKQIADRAARIAELEGQVAKAARNAETAEYFSDN